MAPKQQIYASDGLDLATFGGLGRVLPPSFSPFLHSVPIVVSKPVPSSSVQCSLPFDSEQAAKRSKVSVGPTSMNQHMQIQSTSQPPLLESALEFQKVRPSSSAGVLSAGVPLPHPAPLMVKARPKVKTLQEPLAHLIQQEAAVVPPALSKADLFALRTAIFFWPNCVRLNNEPSPEPGSARLVPK